MKEQWYNNAIIYSLDVETFRDSNGDGIGDFAGLVSKLDHLFGLGINCIWLRPFFPTPLVDDGYDIKDYYQIDNRFGNIGDFVDFFNKARALGIRIIIDLVINHTSDQHEWFQRARENPGSKFRDYYIWRDEKPDYKNSYSNMLGQGGVWSYDEKAGSWYLHHFHKEQPDLNIHNPEVRKEIKKILGFWLQLGISGFRIDSAHILVHESKGSLFEFLEELREFINVRNHEAVLLGEANVAFDQLRSFFSEGGKSRLHLLFNFFANKNIFLAFSRQDAEPLREVIRKLMKIDGQWVNFLRHHDELNLEMLSEQERQEVYEEFAPDENMRIFGHGIRRRLPPMLNNDRRKMELIYVLMFSLPGIPLLNYGEEIGMGDDLSEPGRASVRTVMQWDEHDNAGFSDCTSEKLVHPVIDSGQYDYRKVNVNKQQNDPDSFLNWMGRLISTRKQSPQLGYGKCVLIENNVPSVLSFYSQWEDKVVVLLQNLKDEDCKVNLKPGDKSIIRFTEILSNQKYEKLRNLEYGIPISAFGFRWFKGRLKIS